MIQIFSGFTLADFIAVIDDESLLTIFDDSIPIRSDGMALYKELHPHNIPGNIRRKKVKSIEVGQKIDFVVVVE